ncbi:MAG: ATP-binding protein [Rhodospirillaceae bacterium]
MNTRVARFQAALGRLMRPAYTGLVTSVVAAVFLVVGAWLIAGRDRAHELQDAALDQENISIVLAEQVRQAITAANLVLDATAEDVRQAGAQTPGEFRTLMSDVVVYDRLLQRIRGVPQVDVATIVAFDGTVLNFSRSFPPPPINLSDRDYFIAHSRGSVSPLFVSKPVQNRGNGNWTFYLSRAIRSAEGELLGLVLTGIRVGFFEEFLRTVRISDAATLSLYRSDGVLLAQHPHDEAAMGASFLDTASFRILRGPPRVASRAADPDAASASIVTPRRVPGLPLVVSVADRESVVLADWRYRTGILASGVAIATLCLLALSAINFHLAGGRERILEALKKSKQAAEEASSAKSRFLAVMSHEIRTPMNAVLGMAGVLLESPLSDAQRKQVRLIRDSGDSLLGLLNDILDFSKLEARKVEIERIPFDPSTLTTDAASVMGPRADAKGVAFTVSIAPDLPAAVLGDPSRLRQILFNLISNAIKFTDSGSVTVAIRRAAHVAGALEWTVADTGIGIPRDRIDRLFEEFAQADISITRRFGGSGLGLVICRRLVDLMGGTIAIESEPGRGTVAVVTVPMDEADAGALAHADGDAVDAAAALAAVLARLGRPIRLLLAEDNVTNRLVALSILQHDRVRVDAVANGLEAVEAVARFDYDLILMDVFMPEMDGIEATRRIRARGGRDATVPIVAFTANAFDDDREACRAAGMNDFVAKPIRKSLLLGALARNLAVAAADAPAPHQDTAAPAFDEHALVQLAAEIGAEAVQRVVRAFVGTTTRTLQALSDPAGDPAEALRKVHSLKSAASYVGASRLSRAAIAQESAMRGGRALAPADVAALQAAFEAYCATTAVQAQLNTADAA